MDEDSLRGLRESIEECSEADRKDLVRQFKIALKEASVEIEEATGAKYFAAGMSGVEILVLAHESTKDGWWGITEDIVRRVSHSERLKDSGVSWGAALIDKSPRRGFWVPGENIFQLKTLGLVRLGEVQYHFKRADLEKKPDLAFSFFSVPEFLRVSGLKRES
jgi:hypothetical protein